MLYCYNGTSGYSIKHPLWLKRHEQNLRKQQKQLSKRKKGSNRRNKARQLVAKVHERLSNARQDFLHKLSKRITDESQVIAVESLNIRGMLKNRRLSKAISQSGWATFLNFLDYKLKKKGGVLVEVSRFFPSSKLCSCCGHKYQELTLSERIWTCEKCTTTHIRDEVAAQNIRTEGMRILGLGQSPRGDDVRLKTSFENRHTPIRRCESNVRAWKLSPFPSGMSERRRRSLQLSSVKREPSYEQLTLF